MATTSLQLANLALDLIGANYIAAMNEASKEARACNRNYDICRKAVLRDHPWNFATKRAVLDSADPTPPDFGYENRFALPDDFIRVHTLFYSDGSRVDEGAYRLEGGFLLTDESELWLKYVYDVTDAAKFDPLFDEALSAKLAATICYLITASETRQAEMEQMYRDKLQKAKFTDSAEDPSQQLDVDEWIRARNGNSSNFVRDPMTN